MSWDLNAYQMFQIGWTIAMGLFSLYLYFVGKEQVRSKDLAGYKKEVRQELVDHSHRIAELENLIRRVCALYAEELITARIVEKELADQQPSQPGQEGPLTLAQLVERHLGGYFAEQPDGVPPVGLYDRVLEEVERPLIQLTLAATRGNQVRAAEILGLNRNTLRKKIQDLGVDLTRGRR
jgi:two-component system nitrogen regulation response regulator GlnG